jgi:dienelactone hydrolase
LVPAERAEAFKAALNDAGVDFIFHGYDGVRHAFTNPEAGRFGIDSHKYDAAVDEASWREMLQTFNTVF